MSQTNLMAAPARISAESPHGRSQTITWEPSVSSANRRHSSFNGVPGLPNAGGFAAWSPRGSDAPTDQFVQSLRRPSLFLPPPDASTLQEAPTDHDSFVSPSKLFRQASRQFNEGRTKLRGRIVESYWYRSVSAMQIRAVLQSKPWFALQVMSILSSLFISDIWVICSINDVSVKNAFLSIALAVFLLELLLLPLVDVLYLLSFFHFLDFVGTLAMIWEVPYMFGDDDTSPYTDIMMKRVSNEAVSLLRTARVARLGGRVASSVALIRCLRFFPRLLQNMISSKSGKRTSIGGQSNLSLPFSPAKNGIIAVIQGKLANLLGTVVAFLTILIALAVPLFDTNAYPRADFSPATWVQRVGRNWKQNRYYDALVEMNQMSDFYSTQSFGPYAACPGHQTTGGFVCDSSYNLLATWVPTFRAPNRAASSLVITSDEFMIAFNMQKPLGLRSGLFMLMYCFVIAIMVLTGHALTSVVAHIAVKPLERILETVRQIADTVFNFGGANKQMGALDDIDTSNEMKLLEKVVAKLAAIADLQMKSKIVATTAGMQEEDLGVLSMMAGKKIDAAKDDSRLSKVINPRRRSRRRGAPIMVSSIRVEDYGVTAEIYDSWAFNPLPLSKMQRIALTCNTLFTSRHCAEETVSSQSEIAVVQRFIQACANEYLTVPYHNFAHATDTVHCLSRMLKLLHTEEYLSDIEEFALLVAAVGHDLGHPGVNNVFLVETGDKVALQYNDKSPLENMHCAKLYNLLGNAETALFASLEQSTQTEVRKVVISAILNTDMALHTGMQKSLQMTYQMNQEVFRPKPEGAGLTPEELQIISQADNKQMVIDMSLHAADVANPCKVWDVTKEWALVCLEEFFAQGDREKELGIPVQFLNDREKLNKPNSQIGFIEFMIVPFLVAQLRVFPGLKPLGENLVKNIANWEEIWREEVQPPPAERAKMKARVEKVGVNLSAAWMRAEA